MPARKRRPGCLTKQNGCIHKNVLYPYYTRIIPYNVVGHSAVAMGKWLAWVTWQNSENKTCVRLGHLAVAMGKGGEGGMSTPGMQKHTHMLSQGVVVATSHTANIHNLSTPSYAFQVLQKWAVS